MMASKIQQQITKQTDLVAYGSESINSFLVKSDFNICNADV